MKTNVTGLLLIVAVSANMPGTASADDAAKPLQGVWYGQSMETNGKPLPAEEARRMRFRFVGDKLFIKGNFKDDREEECPFTVKATESPKHLSFSPPKEKNGILGIYEIKGDELKVCLRHSTSTEGRPKEFATKPDSQLIMIVFKKQAPNGK
ncbi:MAG: TIGR03067 domain-containing protein [Gemmataceae bacterium]|nr:TIGR03067 domain-containing protein [Gemmataceae bacterium]